MCLIKIQQMKILIIVLIIQIVTIQSVQASEKNKWRLIKNENEIRVYIYESKSNDIVKAKARTIVNFPINTIKLIIDDISHRHEWVPYLKNSKALSIYKNNKRIEYSHFSAPWPASDRDFVYQIELISESNKQLVYKMRSIESSLMPENNYRIRAELYESIYTLTALNKETTVVDLVFHADPKGWLPNWIINIIQRVLPYKILKNLKSRLKLQLKTKKMKDNKKD